MPKKKHVASQEPEKWTMEFLDERVEAEYDEFSIETKAKIKHIRELIGSVGLTGVGLPYVVHLQGDIWEIRSEAKDGWGRCLYCTKKGKKIILLRCFIKKGNKTPPREIRLAIERMKAYISIADS